VPGVNATAFAASQGESNTWHRTDETSFRWVGMELGRTGAFCLYGAKYFEADAVN
jgi:hypothetical protein